MLEYFEAKFNEHPEKMVSHHINSIPDVPDEGANHSFIVPI